VSEHTDRRLTRRLTSGRHGIVNAKVRPGYDVAVLNVSAGGALVESSHRLLPGSPVDLHLAKQDDHVAVRGRVLRCFVARLRAAGIWYRGAIGFDRHLPWFVDEDPAGYGIPGAELRPRRAGRAADSHIAHG
jgi:hypothetical protein